MAVLAYLQWRHPKKPPDPKPSPKVSIREKILSSKVIRVGFFHYPPLIDYDDAADTVVATGLYADVLKDFAARRSLSIEWCPLKLSEAIQAVTANTIDCYACIMLSDVRYRECDFVGLLHSIAVVGVVRKGDSSVKHPSDLTNTPRMKVAVCTGEIGHHTASTTLRVPSKRLVEVNTSDIAQISAHVREGEATVALADALSCKRMMRRARSEDEFELVFADPPILTVPNGFMIAKGDKDLSDWLDQGIRQSFAHLHGHEMYDALREEFGTVITRLC